MEPHQKKFSIWYFVAAAFVVLMLQSIFFAPHREDLPYSEFKGLVRAGKVVDLVVGERVITGTIPPEGFQFLPEARRKVLEKEGRPHPFATTRVADPSLVGELEAANIRFKGQLESPWWSLFAGWILPAIAFFGLWSLLVRRISPKQGLMAIGKSKAKVYLEKSTGVTFNDVAGIDEARAELVEVVDFLKQPERYRRLGGKIPTGVLIVGAPGTGKTLLARAVAGEAKVPFFSLSGSDFVEMFVGVGAARVRDLFEQAQAHAPSIVFIDELDALGKARSATAMLSGHEEREQTLNQLLAEMDGFDSQKGVIIMAATNRPEILDAALLRPGRFDRKVVVDRPDLRGREQILRVHTRNLKLSSNVDLAELAARSPGFVGADLANVANEAALHATRAGKDAIGMDDFDEAIERVIAGLERKSRVISPKEKEIVAHHEAGHAIVAESRPHADRVAKVSIIPRGVAALGYTRQQPAEDRYLLTRTELLDRIDVLLGGRVAEEIVFNDISTGAEDDLQKATDLARYMLTRFSMSEDLGLPVLEMRPPVFLETEGALLPSQRHEYSEETGKLIDVGIRKILEESHERVRRTLLEKEAALHVLGRLLMEKEVVNRDEVERVFTMETTARPTDGTAAAEAVVPSPS